jgi:peptidoglycan/xylan/chitin deacetylase (PgdA/CDA1 family)
MDTTRWTTSPESDGLSRRLLLAVGGMMLLGGAATDSVRPLSPAGRSRPGLPSPVRPSPVQPVAARRQSPAHHARRHDRGSGAEEQPMRYIHGRKAIALTIDDGPSPAYTPQVLSLLHRYGITASFCMIGVNVAAYPGVARAVADAGHMIVNHTQHHHNLAVMWPAGVADEMDFATEAIHRATGRVPDMFRAPYGAWSPTVLERCWRTGMTPLGWSVDPRDWARPGVTSIIQNIMRNTRTGSIILEHDGGGDRSQTVAALSVVLPRLLDAGYHFRTP